MGISNWRENLAQSSPLHGGRLIFHVGFGCIHNPSLTERRLTGDLRFAINATGRTVRRQRSEALVEFSNAPVAVARQSVIGHASDTRFSLKSNPVPCPTPPLKPPPTPSVIYFAINCKTAARRAAFCFSGRTDPKPHRSSHPTLPRTGLIMRAGLSRAY